MYQDWFEEYENIIASDVDARGIELQIVILNNKDKRYKGVNYEKT